MAPISFYTHPPEGDRNSNYRDKINEISPPTIPLVVGKLILQIECNILIILEHFWDIGFDKDNLLHY